MFKLSEGLSELFFGLWLLFHSLFRPFLVSDHFQANVFVLFVMPLNTDL